MSIEEQLAVELRRVAERLMLTSPDPATLTAFTEQARSFADELDALPVRVGSYADAAGGLLPSDYRRTSPVRGYGNPVAPPASFRSTGRGLDARVTGEVVFGAAYEGPPGHAHGGWIAAVFDEGLGQCMQTEGFTGTLTVVYRSPTPLGQSIALAAWIDRLEGRKTFVRGDMRLGDRLLVEAEGVFITPRGGSQLDAVNDAVLAARPDLAG